jgi:hypothetical protein
MRLGRHLSLAFLGLVLVTTPSWALPAYARLVKQTYGYSVSCVMCHTKEGGSAVTSYGKDFQRNGTSLLALRRIESKDSDRDGVSNLEELQAKSNPGDSVSIPANPGNWLLNSGESAAIPLKELKAGFSDAEGFTVLEGTLKPEQIKAIETNLGTPLLDEDKMPVFYFAVKTVGNKKIKYGVAQFLRTEKFTLLVGVNLKSEVVFVHIITSKDKTLQTESNPDVARLIKKNLLLVNAVFSKKT